MKEVDSFAILRFILFGTFMTFAGCSFQLENQLGNSQDDTASKLLTIPQGAVAFFNSAVCPDGWGAYDLAKGRAILGAGVGNTDSNGDPLTVRTLGSTGGREYTTGIPAINTPAAFPNPAAGRHLAIPNTGFLYAPYTPGINTLPMDGVSADTNIPPAIYRLACRANVNTSVPNSISVARNEGSCASGWSQDSGVNGRTLFGVGSGNKDSDNLNLASRALGSTSGQEYTVLSASNQALNSTSPGPTVTLGVGVNMYSLPPFNSVSALGVTTDSNMPPFISLPYCSPSAPQISLPSKAIMAFDLASCPDGWVSFSAGAGRFIFGSGSGNVDQVGVTLTSRSFASTGGFEYTPGYWTGSNGVTNRVTSPTSVSSLGAITGVQGYAVGSPDTTIAGAKADSNLPPYVVLNWCIASD